MPKTDYGEILCQATDILAHSIIDKITFDKTILCTIIDDSNKKNGEYKVSNGSSSFFAYTTDTSLNNNDNVYVQIPSGDWNEQKFILHKKINSSYQPITYKDPFDSYVNMTGNMITSNKKAEGLCANNPMTKNILLWTYNKGEGLTQDSGKYLFDYTRMGIEASFMSLLQNFKAVSGNYGLCLVIEAEADDKQKASEENLEVETTPYFCYLNCADMVGNPYNYNSFYAQRKIFDISHIKRIEAMSLYFYQTFSGEEGSFKNTQGELIPHGNNIPPNLFVKDITISFGYDTNEFEDDSLILFSQNSVKYYQKEEIPENNHKKIELRWIHKSQNGEYRDVEINDGIDFTLTFYRYCLGARSYNNWSGVDWNPISIQKVKNGQVSYEILDKDWLEYNTISVDSPNGVLRDVSYNATWLLPNINVGEESVKAILEYGDNNRIFSRVISFTNDTEVVNVPTVDALQALSINCMDDSYGNYFIYNIGGPIIDSAQGLIQREFKAYFNSALDVEKDGQSVLTNAESIEWIIPAKNTMIIIDNPPTVSSDGYYHIIRGGERNNKWNIIHNNSQPYRIKNFYNQNYNNNTIKCVVIKDKVTYTAVKELTFGPAGTAGTDYTFILDFEKGITALTLNDDSAVTVKAMLYDYTGKEIDYLAQGATITWEVLNNGGSQDIHIKGFANEEVVELQFTGTEMPEANYTILQATLKDWGDFVLTAKLPIPVRLSKTYEFISGPTMVQYNSMGYLDSYFQNPYEMYYSKNESLTFDWEIVPERKDDMAAGQDEDAFYPVLIKIKDRYYLQPIQMYVSNTRDVFCIKCKSKEGLVWSQPIYLYQNRYPHSILNKWDGNLLIDEHNNSILAAKIAAGKKDSEDNSFSGVIMGDWEDVTGETAVSQVGLYGFHKGAMSFGFKDDGTAFIGKSGTGRIEFDGEDGVIKSATWDAKEDEEEGMFIDVKDGALKMRTSKLYSVAEKPFNDNSQIYYVYEPTYIPVVLNAEGLDLTKKYYYKSYKKTTLNEDDYNTQRNILYYKTYVQCSSASTYNSSIKFYSYQYKEVGTLTEAEFNSNADNKYYIKNGDTYTLASKSDYSNSKVFYTYERLEAQGLTEEDFNKEKNKYYIHDYIKVGDNKFSSTESYYKQDYSVYFFSKNEDGTIIKSDNWNTNNDSNKYVNESYCYWTRETGEDGNEFQYKVAFKDSYDIEKTYYLKMTAAEATSSKYIDLSVVQAVYPFSIGNKEDVGDRNFKINWDGTAYIQNGVFKGNVTADYLTCSSGYIGGWKIDPTSLSGGGIELNSYDGSITGGILRSPYGGMLLEGYLKIADENGIGMDQSYFGFVRANTDTPEDATSKGIGMEMEYAGSTARVKATSINTGFSFTNNGDGGYISIGKVGIDIGVMGDGIFDLKVPAEKQKGIYARFA